MPRSNERRFDSRDEDSSPAAVNDDLRQTGTIKTMVPEKGFGFISADHGRGPEYFFHRSSCEDFDRLAEGVAVTFVPSRGPKGPRAEQVVLA